MQAPNQDSSTAGRTPDDAVAAMPGQPWMGVLLTGPWTLWIRNTDEPNRVRRCLAPGEVAWYGPSVAERRSLFIRMPSGEVQVHRDVNVLGEDEARTGVAATKADEPKPDWVCLPAGGPSGRQPDGIRISGDLGRHLVRLRDETLAWICAELIIDPEPVRVLQLSSPDMVDAHGDPDPDGTAGLYARPMTALDRLVDAFVVHLQSIWPEGVDAVARTICENYLLRACGHRRYLPRSNGAAVLMVSAVLRHGDDLSVAVEDGDGGGGGGGLPFGDGLLAEHAGIIDKVQPIPAAPAQAPRATTKPWFFKRYGEELGKVVGDELAAGAQAPGLDEPAADITRKADERRAAGGR